MVQKMAPVFDQITNLLATPEGNLLYYVILSLSALGALLSCAYIRVNQRLVEGKRMQGGLLVLFLMQLSMVIIAWLIWLGVVNAHTFVPPIDRTVALFALVVIMWLWILPDQNRTGDSVAAGIGLFVLLTGAISLSWWLTQGVNSAFNATMAGAYGYYFGLGLVVAGVIVLVWRKPKIWGYGCLMSGILLAGYLGQYLFSKADSDYPWLIRLGEMIAYPILLVLPKRLVSISGVYKATGIIESDQALKAPPDPKAIASIINLLGETSQQNFYQDLMQLVSKYLNARICMLLMPPKAGEQIIVPIGYDQALAKSIEGFTLDGRTMPSVLEAMRGGKVLLLSSQSGKVEVEMFEQELGLTYTPHLMVQPFNPKGTKASMAVGLIARQNSVIWSEADASYTRDLVEVLIANQGKTQLVPAQPADVEEIQASLRNAQAEALKVQQEYNLLSRKYADLSAQAGKTASQAESMIVLAANNKELQAALVQLENRNRELEMLVTKGRPSIEEVDQLREELRSALADLARIPSTLSKSDQKMLESQLSAMKKLEDLQQFELVTSIAEEFRQPMSAIIGYTDLLLGESVGLLGAMQKKFLERVKASTERMGMLLSELVEVVAIDDGKLDQTPTRVDLASVIDESVNNIIAQISEKNISMRVDLPENLPTVSINRDALQQILANLLENACMITPENGEIKLYARAEKNEDQANFMRISVTDQGGGIARSDIPRVFSRRYKMDNPLIQGIGDTGVGLSIVKSLVELDRGRIWVSTQEGIGSTFSILLPLAEEQSTPESEIPS